MSHLYSLHINADATLLRLRWCIGTTFFMYHPIVQTYKCPNVPSKTPALYANTSYL